MEKALMAGMLTLAMLGCRTAGDAGMTAVADLDPRSGSSVQGIVMMTDEGNGMVRVKLDATGLQPNSRHGFHVHENGDCSAPDATSAGGHYNPMAAPHGAPADAVKHVGDMGNVMSNADGEIHEEMVLDFLSLSGEHSVVNRAVILHAKADDLVSQPSGDAGARIACGVLRLR